MLALHGHVALVYGYEYSLFLVVAQVGDDYGVDELIGGAQIPRAPVENNKDEVNQRVAVFVAFVELADDVLCVAGVCLLAVPKPRTVPQYHVLEGVLRDVHSLRVNANPYLRDFLPEHCVDG